MLRIIIQLNIYRMKKLTLEQAQKFIDDFANESLNNYNDNHPNNIISHADSYKYGYLCVELALLLSKHNDIESILNKYKNLLPMDITKDE
jgi:hypothetical protein